MNRSDLLSYITLEAERLLKEAGCGFPVDIPRIAEHLGIKYHEEMLPSEIDAIYFRTSVGIPHICVNSCRSKSVGRRRYTGAHEIIHHLVTEKLGDRRIVHIETTRPGRGPAERICNYGAALLLMPEKEVKRVWKELRLYPEIQTVRACTHLFGVTASALRIRLTELGLLG